MAPVAGTILFPLPTYHAQRQAQQQWRYGHATITPSRPRRHRSRRPSQLTTQYMNMLLALDGIPRLHNMLAGFFTWILLAGFVLFPATFSGIQELQESGQIVFDFMDLVKNVPLFAIAGICSGTGAIGMIWLWWRWRNNYIWLVNRIFLPGVLNSFTGIISTLVNVYAVHHGELNITSVVTLGVTGGCAIICGGVTLIYSTWKLAEVKRKHDLEVGEEVAGKHGEGMLKQFNRKMRECEPEAGMI